MNYFVYYKNGEELIPFYDWVLEHGSDDEKQTHDVASTDDVPSEDFDLLLDKYLKATGATHVREFDSNGEPVSDLNEVITF
jgi:hypothetical protein